VEVHGFQVFRRAFYEQEQGRLRRIQFRLGVLELPSFDSGDFTDVRKLTQETDHPMHFKLGFFSIPVTRIT
jgi:hypothetical protein